MDEVNWSRKKDINDRILRPHDLNEIALEAFVEWSDASDPFDVVLNGREIDLHVLDLVIE